MKFAIVESVVTPGGHEIDYDRILVEELSALGHEVEFYVPEGHQFKWNYGVPVHKLEGEGVSYKGSKGLKKLYLAVKREINRQKWYKQIFKFATEEKFDAIIFPSATYRYLRALSKSKLKHSAVPVIFLIHGLTPKESVKLKKYADYFRTYKNIKIGVQSFAKEKLDVELKNVDFFYPPNYIPRDITLNNSKNLELVLGFFGQYRKEKNLDDFLDVYIKCNFKVPVKLIVQGSTQTKDDAEDFVRIINKYSVYDNIEFWHKALIGSEWQKGLASVDTLVMPYGNERYLYHTSAILSNAIGFKKTIIIADNVNPEVLEQFNIGKSFQNGDFHSLKNTLELFVNNYSDNKKQYEIELEKAYEMFSPTKLAENIIKLAQDKR